MVTSCILDQQVMQNAAMRTATGCTQGTNIQHQHDDTLIHLATRGNNKILCIPPPHISSSEEILPRRTLAQLRTNKSSFLKSYLHKVNAKSRPSSLCPLCNTHTSSLQLHPHTHHIVTPGLVDRPRWSDCTAGQMDGEAAWWATNGKIGLPQLASVMGVGRQQYHALLHKYI